MRTKGWTDQQLSILLGREKTAVASWFVGQGGPTEAEVDAIDELFGNTIARKALKAKWQSLLEAVDHDSYTFFQESRLRRARVQAALHGGVNLSSNEMDEIALELELSHREQGALDAAFRSAFAENKRSFGGLLLRLEVEAVRTLAHAQPGASGA